MGRAIFNRGSLLGPRVENSSRLFVRQKVRRASKPVTPTVGPERCQRAKPSGPRSRYRHERGLVLPVHFFTAAFVGLGAAVTLLLHGLGFNRRGCSCVSTPQVIVHAETEAIDTLGIPLTAIFAFFSRSGLCRSTRCRHRTVTAVFFDRRPIVDAGVGFKGP